MILLQIECKIHYTGSGSELASAGRVLLTHFQTQGTPVMIGKSAREGREGKGGHVTCTSVCRWRCTGSHNLRSGLQYYQWRDSVSRALTTHISHTPSTPLCTGF